MKKVLVVDLDGTLFDTNTFEHYIVFIAKSALKRFDILTILYLILLVVLRKVRLISTHERMKYYVLKYSSKYSDTKRMKKFVDSLKIYENSKVVSLMKQYRSNGYMTILSTAAPVAYAQFVASAYDIEHYCASDMPINKAWKENVNEQKKVNTLNCINKIDGVLSVLVTDHYDDLPLLSLPKEGNYLVNPSQKTIQYLNESNIIYSLL